MFRSFAVHLMLSISILIIAPSVFAAGEVFVTEAGAIRGYDPVAYHSEHKAVLGSATITYAWNGATWHFVSVDHRAAFAKAPDRFAPRYGGYCAYGTAQGYKVSTQPEAFAIVDGKLYLNYNPAVQTMWNEDQPGYVASADSNWAGLEHAEYISDQDSTEKAEAAKQ
jgi:hypothetical protein